MARPRPKPPKRRVIELCPCSNALKIRAEFFRLNADAGIGDRDLDFVRRRIEVSIDDPAALRSELHAVLDQVPKNLLQTSRIP